MLCKYLTLEVKASGWPQLMDRFPAVSTGTDPMFIYTNSYLFIYCGNLLKQTWIFACPVFASYLKIGVFVMYIQPFSEALAKSSDLLKVIVVG